VPLNAVEALAVTVASLIVARVMYDAAAYTAPP